MDSNTPPELIVRWFRPQGSSALLDLPSAPVAIPSKESNWQAFTEEESAACEEAWWALGPEERRRIHEAEAYGTLYSDIERTEEDEDALKDKVGVAIAKDRLFEVDVRSMRVRRVIVLLTLTACHYTSPL